MEEKDQEKQKEKEPSQNPSKVIFLQKHHSEEQIIGNVDEGIQTRRRMTSTPRRNDVALLSMIEPETFTRARILIGWKPWKKKCLKSRKMRHGSWYLVQRIKI